MTRATWCSAATDHSRDYRGRHRAAVSPRFGRALRLAVVLGVAWWAAVITVAVFGGLWWAVGTGLAGVWLLVGGLAVPSGWWRR